MKADNVTEVPESRRGDGTVPLKAGRVEQGSRVSERRGGSAWRSMAKHVFELLLSSVEDRQFGFYHDRSLTAAKVRDVVLKGNWPKTLTEDQLARLASSSRTRDSAGRSSPPGVF